MKQFIQIFKKVNGTYFLKQYAHAHMLLYSFLLVLVHGFSKKSLEIVRLGMRNKIVKRLRKKYKRFIINFKKENDEKFKTISHEHSNKVWVCWLQGMDNAPEIVKKCYQSLLDNLNDREIILLTNENYKDWVTFPKHIQKKIDNGTITRTHMTDFLRLELLEHYGGTWIDATVFCSGKNIPSYIFNSDFFIYQNMKPGLDGQATRTSTWFITAYTNHPIIVLTKQLLYKYWEKNKHLKDYFLIHDFIELAIENYSDEWLKVIPISNSIPHILLLRFSEQYNENIWNAAKEMTPFHKLSWKFNEQQMKEFNKPNTFYKVVLNL